MRTVGTTPSATVSSPTISRAYGLGFYEYFLLSEDIGAEPLPILNVGLVCQYQNHDESAHASLNELQPFIDDVLRSY